MSYRVHIDDKLWSASVNGVILHKPALSRFREGESTLISTRLRFWHLHKPWLGRC